MQNTLTIYYTFAPLYIQNIPQRALLPLTKEWHGPQLIHAVNLPFQVVSYNGFLDTIVVRIFMSDWRKKFKILQKETRVVDMLRQR